ncbi:MAG: SHOCT domain-containing protein [Rhodanobacter sp.]|nr:MAG: SHOCT domain-containing protein [Rhodanobacter sp.]
MNGMGMGMGGPGVMWIFFILFWVLFIAGVVTVVRWLLRDKAESPLKILQRRYARGEIDQETYVRMRRDCIRPQSGPRSWNAWLRASA